MSIRICHKVGGDLIGIRPVYSNDGAYIYTVTNDGVCAYSAGTGDCVRKYIQDGQSSGAQERACAGDIVGVVVTESHVYACTQQFFVLQWSRHTGELLKKKSLLRSSSSRYKAFDVQIVEHGSGGEEEARPELFVAAETTEGEEQTVAVFAYTLLGLKLAASFSLAGAPRPKCLAFGRGGNGRHFAATIRGHDLFIHDLSGKESLKRLSTRDAVLTVVAAHPTECTVAVGDSLGRLLLYQRVLGRAEVPPRSVRHWHNHPLADAAFSPSGTELYTGGNECVLVKWNVQNPEVRAFLPRIQAPIRHVAVSPAGTSAALCLADSAIMVVSPGMAVARLIQRFTRHLTPVAGQRPFPAGMAYDPNSRSLVLNGRPGHLQFVGLRGHEILRSMDVTEANCMAQERLVELVNFEVARAALSGDGRWLATAEVRDDRETTIEVRLKLWLYNGERQSFVLNTCVDLPHYDGEVVDVKFRPLRNAGAETAQYMLVTTGADGKFRVWTTASVALGSDGRTSVTWNCDRVGFYRNEAPGPMAFSSDGSVLAIAFGAALTVWDTDTFEMAASLARGAEPIRHVALEQKSCSHHAVAATATTLQVWNLLSLTVVWSAEVAVRSLAADPLSEHMAAFTADLRLYVFRPAVPRPAFILSDARIGPDVLSAVFVPRPPDARHTAGALPLWMQKSQLYFLTSSQELLSIEKEELELADPLPVVNTGENEVAQTAFARLRAKQVRGGDRNEEEQARAEQRIYTRLGTAVEDSVRQLLAAPVTTSAHLSLLCKGFLKAFLAETKYEGAQSPKRVVRKAETSPERSSSDDSEDSTEVYNRIVAYLETGEGTPPKNSAQFKKTGKRKWTDIWKEDGSDGSGADVWPSAPAPATPDAQPARKKGEGSDAREPRTAKEAKRARKAEKKRLKRERRSGRANSFVFDEESGFNLSKLFVDTAIK